jgi:predicted O-methyltransferase YrrM
VIDETLFREAEKIEGWMAFEDLTFLAQQAQKHTRILEVGSWLGRSTRALADNTKGVVYAVDTWDGSDEQFQKDFLAGKPKDWLFEEFKRNMGANTRPIRLTSLEAAAELGELRFDMIFLDASHDYENVKADILAWKPLLTKGGLFCGHDRYPTARAVNELLTGVKYVADGIIWYTEE